MKRFISHRGNIFGRIESEENKPSYIESALSDGYDVEIDLWLIGDNLFLGHDFPDYQIDLKWIEERSKRLWVHCKNPEAVVFLCGLENGINYFWHQEDKLTLTSRGHIWVYPGNQPIKNSIAVMPEIHDENVDACLGICSDYIGNYRG